MRMYDIIDKKRRGESLSDEEIRFVADGTVSGAIPDYQLSAWLMAVCIMGMDARETVTLTKAMRDSGDTADLSRFGGMCVDKHSTGGVGDKTSLIVAPIVAACGAKVAKMSGRGLGHTGGTVDKLESIKGFKTSLSAEDFARQVEKIGIAIVGQSGNFAPADKKLYALRDVTATVQSIPLIASSIMSKKLASGSDSIVLDVKYGSGAFMKTPEDAKALADKMVDIGKSCQKKVRALITNMDIPLGSAVGNAVEVLEAVKVLGGEADSPDLRDVSLALAANMLVLCHGISLDEAADAVNECVRSGRALGKFREWIKHQGGSDGFIEDESEIFAPKFEYRLKAAEGGYIYAMDTEKVGKAACLLGAGREKSDDVIDMHAGLKLKKKTGERISVGEDIAVLYANDEEKLQKGAELLSEAYLIKDAPPKMLPLIYAISE